MMQHDGGQASEDHLQGCDSSAGDDFRRLQTGTSDVHVGVATAIDLLLLPPGTACGSAAAAAPLPLKIQGRTFSLMFMRPALLLRFVLVISSRTNDADLQDGRRKYLKRRFQADRVVLVLHFVRHEEALFSSSSLSSGQTVVTFRKHTREEQREHLFMSRTVRSLMTQWTSEELQQLMKT